MKSHIIRHTSYIAVALLMIACRPSPSVYRGMPATYATAYQQAHGRCYDSISYAVVSLDLYSDGLELTEDKGIIGTGYNLYLSDIFVPDSLLEEGFYQSVPQDSLSALDFGLSPFSFLPGKSFEGYPTGTYILNIENDHVKQIQLVDSGNMTYRNDSLLFTLYYKNTYGGKATYRCSFHGPLIPWLKR